MLEVNQIINECYILRRRVGEDSFSEWWQASAIFVASNFLLRFIKDQYAADEEKSRSFFELAKKRVTIVSPAILSLIEIDRFDNRFFVASEYDGHTHLESILDSGRRFSVEHACRLMIELAEGVGAFHLRGEAFGALTPESVVVHGFGERIDELKLLMPGYEPFFGLVPENRADEYKNAWGYASPELKRGKKTGQRSDIYSLGVLLFRLLAGKIPYGSRSGIRVRTRSAAPANVAAALARRGIPRELAIVTVKALRKNPDLRHDDAVAFIADLRRILEARREAWINAGEADPIADLATLNLKKARADAHEIVRSLETVNYFKYLSNSGASLSPVPFETIEVAEEVLELEELTELEEVETDDTDDDDSITTERYVNEGYATVEARTTFAVPEPKARTTGEHPTSPAAPVPGLENPFIGTGIDGTARTGAGKPTEETASYVPAAPSRNSEMGAEVAETPVAQAAAPPAARNTTRKKKPVQTHLVWRHAGGTPQDVASAIIEAAERAREGFGIVKFIEDPRSGDPAMLVAESIRSLRPTARVVDIGILPEGATLEAVLEALERSIRAPELDFGLAPSGKKRSTTRLAARSAKALAALADRNRPLVIVARGAESVSRSAHRLILELARIAPGVPLCAFFFFDAGKAPSWHVLAALDEA